MRKQKQAIQPDVEYYLYGKTPVMIVRDQDFASVKAFQSSTKRFVSDFGFWGLIMFDRDDLAKKTNRQDFETTVLQLGGSKAMLNAAVSV